MTFHCSALARTSLILLLPLAAACSGPQANSVPPNKTVILDAGAPVRAATPVSAPVANNTSPPAPQAAPPAPRPTATTAPVATAPAPRQNPSATTSAYRMPEGVYRCDEGKRVTLKQSSADGQSITIHANGADTLLKFVPVSSGALRYENSATKLTWILTADKGMLFDNKKGQRLANNCKL